MKAKINPKLLDEIKEANQLGTDIELAKFLKLAPSTLSGIRNGASPKLATAIVIFDAAGVTDIRKAVLRQGEARAA